MTAAPVDTAEARRRAMDPGPGLVVRMADEIDDLRSRLEWMTADRDRLTEELRLTAGDYETACERADRLQAEIDRLAGVRLGHAVGDTGD